MGEKKNRITRDSVSLETKTNRMTRDSVSLESKNQMTRDSVSLESKTNCMMRDLVSLESKTNQMTYLPILLNTNPVPILGLTMPIFVKYTHISSTSKKNDHPKRLFEGEP